MRSVILCWDTVVCGSSAMTRTVSVHRVAPPCRTSTGYRACGVGSHGHCQRPGARRRDVRQYVDHRRRGSRHRNLDDALLFPSAMTAIVPDGIGWPVTNFPAIVVGARYKWSDESQYEKYYNKILALSFVALLLSERAVEKLFSDGALLTETATQQLSLAAMMLTAGEFMGFFSWWPRRSLREPHLHPRRHRIAAAVGIRGFSCRSHTGWSARRETSGTSDGQGHDESFCSSSTL